MNCYLSFRISSIDGQYVIPFQQEDNAEYVADRVKKEFGIINQLRGKIYGSEIQSKAIITQIVQSQDVITFDIKSTSENYPKMMLEFYRQPIITPPYQSSTTFIVFTTLNYHSMTNGNKINVDIENDTIQTLQQKIKDMIRQNFKSQINDIKLESMYILLFLPGGIPFLKGNIQNFINSFPDFMPHLYAIILYDKSITNQVLDETYDNVCNISTKTMKNLLSPDYDSDNDGLHIIATILGYIQRKGPKTKQMIYSIAKFCPFAPLISGLYNLFFFKRVTGRTIIQITASLIPLFNQMDQNSNILSSTIKCMTYFMNVKISDRIPCTVFARPFYNIGFEKYFYDTFAEDDFPNIECIVGFDPDFRDYDWIRFELRKLEKSDFESAMKSTKMLQMISPMKLKVMHRVSIFKGKNGAFLFVSECDSDYRFVEYINPEKGIIEKDTYENIAKMNMSLKANIDQWIEYNNYGEDDEDYEDDDEIKNIIYFRKTGNTINHPKYVILLKEKAISSQKFCMKNSMDPPKRHRLQLNDK